MAEEHKSSELQDIKELVDELYNYRDCYFETHSVEEAARKQEDVTLELEKVLKKLQEKEDSYKHKAEFLLLKGRCLNVAPDFSVAAEDCLSRAVKLEPGLVDGWNTLGEQYWKKGDLMAAKNCFTGALQQSKNKVSLRNMSMVLRQLPAADGDTHGKQVMESVDMARQAVQLDVADGTSWYILGNAYVSLFFSCGQRPQFSTQALSAYAQAERVDRAAACYPELHFNRAILFQYEEMFGSALGGYSRAAALDPGWPVPEHVVSGPVFLSRFPLMDGSRGQPGVAAIILADARPQRRRGRPGEGGVQSGVPGSHGLVSSTFSSFLSSLSPRSIFPLLSSTFGMVDCEETCVVVMVYNTADSWGVLIGDTVVVPEPRVKRHSITHKDRSFDFKSIRVDSPLFLIVNGRTQNAQSLIVTSVSYKPQSE